MFLDAIKNEITPLVKCFIGYPDTGSKPAYAVIRSTTSYSVNDISGDILALQSTLHIYCVTKGFTASQKMASDIANLLSGKHFNGKALILNSIDYQGIVEGNHETVVSLTYEGGKPE